MKRPTKLAVRELGPLRAGHAGLGLVARLAMKATSYGKSSTGDSYLFLSRSTDPQSQSTGGSCVHLCTATDAKCRYTHKRVGFSCFAASRDAQNAGGVSAATRDESETARRPRETHTSKIELPAQQTKLSVEFQMRATPAPQLDGQSGFCGRVGVSARFRFVRQAARLVDGHTGAGNRRHCLPKFMNCFRHGSFSQKNPRVSAAVSSPCLGPQ